MSKSSTITITFSEVVEPHVGCKQIGTKIENGPSVEDLYLTKKAIIEWLKIHSLPIPEITIEEMYGDDAAVMIIRKLKAHDLSIFETMKNLNWDKQYLDSRRGKILNKLARHNLCFTDECMEPNYEAGAGRTYAFSNLPVPFQMMRNMLTASLHVNKRLYSEQYSQSLYAEGNYYYDASKCYIGWHGDVERSVVVGYRMGETFPLYFWYFDVLENKVTPYKDADGNDKVYKFDLEDGDSYIMSNGANGSYWRHKKAHYRHAAGFLETIIKTQPKVPLCFQSGKFAKTMCKD